MARTARRSIRDKYRREEAASPGPSGLFASRMRSYALRRLRPRRRDLPRQDVGGGCETYDGRAGHGARVADAVERDDTDGVAAALRRDAAAGAARGARAADDAVDPDRQPADAVDVGR